MNDVDTIREAGPDAVAAARARREEYAKKRNAVMELQRQLKEAEAEEERLLERIVEDFIEHGTDRFDVDLEDVDYNGEPGPLHVTLTLKDDTKIAARVDDLVDGPQLHEDQAASVKALANRRIIEALRALGLEQYVQPESWNWSGLRSYVDKELDAGRELAPALAAVLNVIEGHKVNVRRTRKAAKS